MQKNKLTIIINKPVKDVWDFTLNPKNTPKWILSCKKEIAHEWPVKVGTLYENTTKNGSVFKFKITELEPYDHFSLVGEDGVYNCRYSFKDLINSTEFEYLEWMDKGELEAPFVQEVLEKLKEVNQRHCPSCQKKPVELVR